MFFLQDSWKHSASQHTNWTTKLIDQKIQNERYSLGLHHTLFEQKKYAKSLQFSSPKDEAKISKVSTPNTNYFKYYNDNNNITILKKKKFQAQFTLQTAH